MLNNRVNTALSSKVTSNDDGYLATQSAPVTACPAVAGAVATNALANAGAFAAGAGVVTGAYAVGKAVG